MSGCPGQAGGNLAPLGSHCGGCCGLHQSYGLLEPQQELPVRPLGLGPGVESQKAGSSGIHDSLDQQAHSAHRSSVPQ